MKSIKILVSALLLVGTATVATAQDNVGNMPAKVDNTASKSVTFGVKGGVNFANVVGGDENPESRTSFHAGVFTEIPVSDVFSVQVEALYSGQGFDVKNLQGSDGDNAEVQLDYINVPVLAKIYVTKGLSIDVGPQFSYLVNDEFDFNPNSNDGDIDLTNTRFEPNKFDVGVAGGLTFQTEMGLFATGRYTYGFTKLYDTNKSGDIGFDGLHNQVFQISLGYKF
ncbi:hypothetical protein FNO01nite_18080 [Flavobacterium noncentrifugens]|uniref:Outer membrane protein beta-barrel domain-containing protein n=1 Tax=Flavobacterium noncentrifugens TaxID=1128970 RepID=A0A1G8Y8Z5_9FLAO|nr:porin family protein [Flavobacterium noncentrifugens]GEP51136.1 hypothetical protein FNO01nite_18080 [Flavobacterium noncentrifugens]SDJ99322.1 Outer membrane protein beta-barrel domain-containing protein [Flavobacterium noncentrifugens]